MSQDTDDTVYALAFSDGRFLMVWNPAREGWEAPGGHIKEGETPEQGARREFVEESGYDVDIVETRDLGHCWVCAAVLKGKISERPEMRCALFSALPEELAFDREEYLDTVPWAQAAISSKGRTKPFLYPLQIRRSSLAAEIE